MTLIPNLDVYPRFVQYTDSMKSRLSLVGIDTTQPVMYGADRGDEGEFMFVALPLYDLANDGLDKDDIDKLYSIMAFFVDNVIGAGNIYLTNRNGKLVIEIAW